MKKIIISMLMFISLIIPYNVWATSTTEAKEKIDVSKGCNLKVIYEYDDYDFDDVEVKIYHIASVTSDFQYNLSSKLEEYPIKINGLKTDSEWDALEQTLNAYISADNIEEMLLEKIDNNTINITNLEPGLYFIKIDKIDTDDYTLLFDSFLISVPELLDDGTWNYDIEVYPKAEEYTPKYDEIKYTVVKQWIDDKKKRPSSVDIEIYEDGELSSKQILSSKNNWTYEWITDDDGSIWTVVERNVPKGYNVTITKNKFNFNIVNIDPNSKGGNPQTGDNIKLYFYLLAGTFIGLILLAISFVVQNKQEI